MAVDWHDTNMSLFIFPFFCRLAFGLFLVLRNVESHPKNIPARVFGSMYTELCWEHTGWKCQGPWCPAPTQHECWHPGSPQRPQLCASPAWHSRSIPSLTWTTASCCGATSPFPDDSWGPAPLPVYWPSVKCLFSLLPILLSGLSVFFLLTCRISLLPLNLGQRRGSHAIAA